MRYFDVISSIGPTISDADTYSREIVKVKQS